MRNIAFLIFGILMSISASSQEYLDGVLFEDFVYYDHLKTVQFSHSSLSSTLPIIDLNRPGSLTLSFDDLEGGDNYYTYRLIHCTKDWQPSDLDEFDYVYGFNGEEIEDQFYSESRITDYTHYRLRLPNDDIKWTISGNYLLIIYEGDVEDQVPVITRRLMVVEKLVDVGLGVKTPVDVLKLKSHHQINLTLFPGEFRINNPLSEITATVLQNGRWDNAQYGIHPKFVAGKSIDWDKARGISFQALKDFRVFDIRSLEYTGEKVNSIDLYNDGIDVLLDLGRPRTNKNFNPNIGTNGQVYIDNSRNDPYGLRNEYARVIFSLENKWQYDHDVYIVGPFTDWHALPEFKMEFDEERKIYLGEAILKQGYYNYMYGVYKEDGLDCERIEGSWYETLNNYTALIYYTEFGSRYDRLIGVGNGSTRQN